MMHLMHHKSHMCHWWHARLCAPCQGISWVTHSSLFQHLQALQRHVASIPQVGMQNSRLGVYLALAHFPDPLICNYWNCSRLFGTFHHAGGHAEQRAEGVPGAGALFGPPGLTCKLMELSLDCLVHFTAQVGMLNSALGVYLALAHILRTRQCANVSCLSCRWACRTARWGRTWRWRTFRTP